MLVDLLRDPDAPSVRAFLEEHLRAGGRLLQVAGAMEVVYHGRAASTADAGDYLLLLKPDGSLQIHAARGIKPLNWQPRTDGLEVGLDDGRATLLAERASPHELVRVAFLATALVAAYAPRDEGGFVLQGSEADMQRALARRPELIEPDLEVLEVELPTDVGGIDLFARDRAGGLVVVELKRAKASHEAVHQLARYVERVAEVTQEAVRGVLAAPEATGPARERLRALGLEFREVTALPVGDAGPEQLGLFDGD